MCKHGGPFWLDTIDMEVHIDGLVQDCSNSSALAMELLQSWPRVGVTKVPFVNFSVSKIFDLAKVPVTFFKSHSYLTGVTAAELRQHLSNMNVVFNS